MKIINIFFDREEQMNNERNKKEVGVKYDSYNKYFSCKFDSKDIPLSYIKTDTALNTKMTNIENNKIKMRNKLAKNKFIDKRKAKMDTASDLNLVNSMTIVPGYKRAEITSNRELVESGDNDKCALVYIKLPAGKEILNIELEDCNAITSMLDKNKNELFMAIVATKKARRWRVSVTSDTTLCNIYPSEYKQVYFKSGLDNKSSKDRLEIPTLLTIRDHLNNICISNDKRARYTKIVGDKEIFTCYSKFILSKTVTLSRTNIRRPITLWKDNSVETPVFQAVINKFKKAGITVITK